MADGIGSGLNNLFQNKMFLQYLSAAGGALSEGKPIGPAINQITQQNISSQSHLGLLKKMLGGYPAGSKISADDKGISLKIPHQQESNITEQTLVDGQQSTTQPIDQQQNVTQPIQPTQAIAPIQQNQTMSAMLAGQNPIDSLTAGDLAGLSPAEISNALQLKFTQDKMVQDQSQFDQTMGLNISKLMQEKDERTPAIKNYEYAQKQGYTGSFAEFDKDLKTTHQKDYEYAVKQGYSGDFQQWVTEMAKAGAINLSMGDQVKLAADKAKAVGEVGHELDVKSPDYVNKVRSEIMKDKAKWMLPDDKILGEIKTKYNVKDDEKATEIYQRALLIEELDKRITQKYPNAQIKNGGWYNGSELIRSLP